MVQRLMVWPTRLPSGLEGLADQVATQLGVDDVVGLDDLSSLASQRSSGHDALVLVIDAAVAAGHDAADVVASVTALRDHEHLDVVAVVGDGYLGTDHADVGASVAGAAAVATMRSMATRRDASGRANVVAIPDALFDRAGVHRGPLKQVVEAIDVVNAVAFFLSEEGGYLNGQVLFVDSGRQVFSSMSA